MYIDVKFKGRKAFYLVDTPVKPGSGFSTLRKIKRVMAGGLKYSAEHPDQYASLKPHELLQVLKGKAEEIYSGYVRKLRSTSFVARLVFPLKERTSVPLECKAQCSKFNNFCGDIRGVIYSYLSVAEIFRMRSTNYFYLKDDQAKATLAQRACTWGYQGSQNPKDKEWLYYVQELFQEIKEGCKQRIIPSNYVVKRKIAFVSWGISPERTIQRLKKLAIWDIVDDSVIQMFSKLSPQFLKLRQLLRELPNREELPTHKNPLTGQNSLIENLKGAAPDKDFVELLLRWGVNPNFFCDKGYTPFHTAAYKCFVEGMQLLLDFGAKVNAQDKDGITAFQIACGWNGADQPNVQIVELLLKMGADPNICNNLGYTSFHTVACRGFLKGVQLLLDVGAEVNARDKVGVTALHLACGWLKECQPKSAQSVELLLQNGADPNIVSNKGYTSLHVAGLRGFLEGLRVLIRAGVPVDQQNRHGMTALMIACCKDGTHSAEIVRFLLENGADPNLSDNDGWFPLHYAAVAGFSDCIPWLLKYGAKIDAQHQTSGATALAVACGLRNTGQPSIEVVQQLVLGGADVNITDKNGYPPVYHAARNNFAKGADFLYHWPISLEKIEKARALRAPKIEK